MASRGWGHVPVLCVPGGVAKLGIRFESTRRINGYPPIPWKSLNVEKLAELRRCNQIVLPMSASTICKRNEHYFGDVALRRHVVERLPY